MNLLLFILFGFVVGLIARALVPGKQKLGIVWTTLLGIGGALLGGIVANALTGAPLTRPDPAGFIGAVIGAIVLLVAYVGITRRSGGTRLGGPGRVTR